MKNANYQRDSRDQEPFDDLPDENPESIEQDDDLETDVDDEDVYRLDDPHDPIVQLMSWFSWTNFRR